MSETPTHAVFTVRVADHEQEPKRTAWRIRHAAETIGTLCADFTRDDQGTPVQSPDGTFEVHAPSRATLDTLRSMLTEHEGLIIVSEEEAPGLGILIETTGDPR